MRLSLRDKIAYIGQAPNVPQGIPYTSNPAAPWASQEASSFYGRAQNSYFCPQCKSVNLFINEDKNMGHCGDCQSRFSILDFQQGNMFPYVEIPRSTGLLDISQGGNAYPPAHYTSEYGSGAASQWWGTGKS